MKTIRATIPYSTLTLFDIKRDNKLEGVLYFQEPKIATASNSTALPTKQRWINSRYTNPYNDLLNLKALAIVCLLISLLGLFSFILPIISAEARLKLNYLTKNTQTFLKSVTPQKKPLLNLSNFTSSYDYLVKKASAQTAPSQNESQEFRLVIPKIFLEANVIPNVDPTIDTNYRDELKDNVAHAKGSYLPGQDGLVFLFAHSTDTPENILQYSAKFYGLKELELGDEIDLFYHGNHYSYKVTDKKVTDPFDLDTIRSSDADLILQTCWPPGTDWERLLIMANQTT